ncbi:MAG: hypothetical protein WCI03_04870 [bacterium]|jgi:hypothetical protein
MSENKKIHSIFSSGELLEDPVIRKFRNTATKIEEKAACRNFRHTADYGKRILATVSQELTAEYGREANCSELTHTDRFANVSTPSTQLNGRHGFDRLTAGGGRPSVPHLLVNPKCAKDSHILSWSHYVEFLGIWETVFQSQVYYGEFAIIKSQAVQCDQNILNCKALEIRQTVSAELALKGEFEATIAAEGRAMKKMEFKI